MKNRYSKNESYKITDQPIKGTCYVCNKEIYFGDEYKIENDKAYCSFLCYSEINAPDPPAHGSEDSFPDNPLGVVDGQVRHCKDDFRNNP